MDLEDDKTAVTVKTEETRESVSSRLLWIASLKQQQRRQRQPCDPLVQILGFSPNTNLALAAAHESHKGCS